MADIADRRAEGRSAYARRDWAGAYGVLSGLRRDHDLDGDDLSVLGDAAWWLGLIRESLEACEASHERFLAEGRVDRAAMVALEAGFNWTLRGEPEIGAGWISRARRLLEGLPPSTGHGFLLWMDASAREAAGDTAGALEQARRVRGLGRDLGEPMVACFGLALEGSLLIRGGHPSRGLALLDEAMLPVLAGRLPLEAAGNLYCQMMSMCHDLADVPRARRWTRATRRWCDTFSSAVMFVGICRVHRAQLLRLSGDWEAAEREASAASTELAELNVEAVAEARYELAEIHRLRGDLDGAEAWYAAAAELGRSPQPGAALLLVAHGRPEEAVVAVRRALLEQGDPFRRARLLAAQLEVACEAGDAVLADSSAAELMTLADTYGSPGFRAWAAQSQGASALCRGEPNAAVAPLRDALARYESMGATYDAAISRVLLGRAFRGLGERAAADAEMHAAREVFEGLGAGPRLAWLNQPTRPDPRPATGGLTEREAQVLTLVAQGLSNRDVARHLVISEKTVARHLANVYAKLDVGSRTAASAWAHRHGLVGPST
jgi:DNA-binding CsgD family transcriptional regulator